MRVPDGMNNRANLTSRHRLRGFDYSVAGYYFVTVCVHERRDLLGAIRNGEVSLSDAGPMLEAIILRLPDAFPHVAVDTFVVMPDHFHVLLYISMENESTSLGEVMKWIKGVGTTEYRRGVIEQGWPRYNQHLWQSGYYDEIVRSEKQLYAIQQYIEDNPRRWDSDEM